MLHGIYKHGWLSKQTVEGGEGGGGGGEDGRRGGGGSAPHPWKSGVGGQRRRCD
jgi:hypothetical protein